MERPKPTRSPQQRDYTIGILFFLGLACLVGSAFTWDHNLKGAASLLAVGILFLLAQVWIPKVGDDE